MLWRLILRGITCLFNTFVFIYIPCSSYISLNITTGPLNSHSHLRAFAYNRHLISPRVGSWGSCNFCDFDICFEVYWDITRASSIINEVIRPILNFFYDKILHAQKAQKEYKAPKVPNNSFKLFIFFHDKILHAQKALKEYKAPKVPKDSFKLFIYFFSW